MNELNHRCVVRLRRLVADYDAAGFCNCIPYEELGDFMVGHRHAILALLETLPALNGDCEECGPPLSAAFPASYEKPYYEDGGE